MCEKATTFSRVFSTFSPGIRLFPPSGNSRGDLSVQTERSKGGFGRRRMLLGRAKSCRWQVFVRRRPPKQGELRTDVSKATMFQGDGAAKGFNFVSGKVLFGCADSRFVEPRISRGRTNCHFLRCAKSNQKARARTCKKLPVASFCASEQLFPTFCKVQKVGQKTL